MEIRFRTKKLEKQYVDSREANKAYGADVGRKYIQRIQIIDKADSLNEILKLPGLRCHTLKGDRRGQYAVKLTGSYRLIFTLEGENLETVCVEEVSKHYGD